MPLNRVLAWCGAIVLTLSCAGAGPPVSISPNALTASSDSAATAFARRLTLWGFTAAQQDSGGTTIIKGSLRLPHGRKLAGHPFGYWADCGKQFAESRQHSRRDADRDLRRG